MSDETLEQYESPSDISIQQLIDALLDESSPLNPRFLYRMSDLEGQDLQVVVHNWSRIPLWRRQALMEDLNLLAETDYLLSFESVGRLALLDQDAQVRFGGIQTLMTCECFKLDLASIFMELAENDPDESVRAIAASALGPFVYQGELDQVPEDLKLDIEDRLMNIVKSEDQAQVRQRALEALGFSGREEVAELIEDNYQLDNPEWVASAIYAMGRSADERWKPYILEKVDHPRANIRVEAVRAAGELGLQAVRRKLLRYIDEGSPELREVSIWSLSQIGGEGIQEKFIHEIRNAETDDEINFLEQALENLAFNSEENAGLGVLFVPTDNTDEQDIDEFAWDVMDDNFDEETLATDFLQNDEEELDLWSIEDLINDDDIMDDDEESGD